MEEFARSVYENYVSLREKIKSVISSENLDNDFWVLFSNYSQYAEKIEEFQVENSKIEQTILSLSNDYHSLLNKKMENAEVLSKNLLVFSNIQDSLEKLQLFFQTQIKAEIVQLEKDFSSLIKPSLLPQAYEELLNEIKRRRSVFHHLKRVNDEVN